METNVSLDHLSSERQKISHLSPKEIATQEHFWEEVRKAYKPSPDFINLENGYYGVMPQFTLEAQIKHTIDLNLQSTYYMRNQKDKDLLQIKHQLATILGAEAENIAFTRNATEGLNLLISGITLKSGEEVIASRQDYPTGLEALSQRCNKEGIKQKLIDLPLHPVNDEEIVHCFEQAIGQDTRLMIVTYLIHWTGQILPVKKIIEMAHRKGVEVIVDAAHAFAHVDFDWKELQCEYLIANLHKWLAGPLTSGIVVVKKEKIQKITPLLASVHIPKEDIRKLENTSATPMPVFMSLFEAIRFHKLLGVQVKQARLDYLKNYWVNQVKGLEYVNINTPLEEGRSVAIANFGIKGMGAAQVAKILWEKYKIFSVGFELEFVNGVRITPQFYNTMAELDLLVNAIKEIQQGI